MKLVYPLSPVHVNQPFGSNPDYYARFKQADGTPEKGHNGIDLQAYHGQPVYAAHDGYAFYVGPDAHGGDGIYLQIQEDGKYWTCIYWHLCAKGDPQFPPQVDSNGKFVKQGDLLGYADNTGAPFESSGDHLHFGLAETNAGGGFLSQNNGYGGCSDPQPYLDSDSDLQNTLKDEVQVLNQTTEPSVRQSLIALIVQQARKLLGF